ncbi:MAG: type II toxin-antitoxin system RelE/ParE family toxin [Candidatus Marinimicrobia bacterium]|jgi:phage-related protein|nr:type II toxin-antitoxin system RelE/ParE family toxin [Candidatus Neomarinimicrobiota bacterium]MBT4177212.1 type II toxin-antitoxin system RelE/ParE family toxin [Candidatus Neomarinimicrobiota bacterium]MBT6160055.1 type II toxin-antitoxin system RelE/ParE family toxin [Candidatus Neomarinimicrobiota bacterium]
MDRWAIEYYEDNRGIRPVEAYIDSLPVEKQANVFRVFELIEEFGIQLGTPYLKHIDGKIWEMRPGKERILYFTFTGKKFVLLTGFTKKTRKTPKKEIKIAQKRKKDYETKNKC